MAVILSLTMFVISSKFIRSAFEKKSADITRTNADIAKMVLDKRAAILKNSNHDIEFLFSSKADTYLSGDIETFEKEIIALYDSSFANDVDVFFFESAKGDYIFDASTPFYDTSKIKTYMTANGRFLRDGIKLIQSESSNGILIALSGSSEVISPTTGELAGYFYTGIILNSSAGLISEILTSTNISEAAIIYGDTIVTGNNSKSTEEIINICYNNNSVIISKTEVAYCSNILISQEGISLKFFQSLPDSFIGNVIDQSKKMGYIAISIVSIITIIAGYFMNLITVRSLYRVVDYTRLLLSGESNQYKQSLIFEFNMLAEQIAGISDDLTETQAYMKNLINNAEAPIAIWDKNGNITLFNNALEKFSGYQSEQVLGKHLSHIYNIFPYANVSVNSRELKESSATQFESVLIHKTSKKVSVILWNLTDVYNDQTYSGTILQGIDITEIKAAEEKMMLASKVFENTLDGMLVVNVDGDIISCNDSFAKMTGYSKLELPGQNVKIFRPDDYSPDFYKIMIDRLKYYGKWSGEALQRKKNGETFPAIITISTIRNQQGEVTDYVTAVHDITDRKKYEDDIKYQATHDLLTGMPNRLYFTDTLAECIDNNPDHKELTVMFLDLDRFKNLNDTLGHSTGDKVLEILSERIKNIVRPTTIAARFSGDEFTFLFTDLSDRESIQKRADKIIKKISEPLTVQGYELFIQMSAGISVYPENGKTASELIKNAEIAMFQAKSKGRNNTQFFSENLGNKLQDRLVLESKLNRAIENNEFTLYYQPKINLLNNSIMGMEALLRWNNPDLGFTPPDIFIPIAEENGLILPIGEWVFERALKDTAELHKMGYDQLKVAINLSLRQFMKKDLTDYIKKTKEKTGIDNMSFELEITENIFTEDLNYISKIMSDISALNVTFAIDDFGTGYSSIGYLKTMPINTLKIDKSYVGTMDTNQDNVSIVASVILMAKSLGLTIVAEGAETDTQVSILKDLGCDIVQGYHYGRPMPYDQFLNFLEAWDKGE